MKRLNKLVNPVNAIENDLVVLDYQNKRVFPY